MNNSSIDTEPVVELTHTTVLCYKSRNGEIKELQIIQPLEPGQQKLGFREIQLLGQEISKHLREDG